MRGCDFRDVRMRGGDFCRAVLEGARFGRAQLTTADFRGANLQGAREMTPEMLMQSLTDRATVLPNGKLGPYMKYSGAEKPA
jgi:hypothetical protein